jgi:23S rRNA (uracil1939-C5)-methyltransferase
VSRRPVRTPRPANARRSDEMESGVIEVVGDSLVGGGDCLVRRPGEPVIFVPGLLPGERARVRFTESRRDYARAVVVELLDSSPDRIVPPCPRVAAGCGGCNWQHLRVEAQHNYKRMIVVDALRRGAGLMDAETLVVLGGASDPVGYRTTVRAAVDTSGRAGFRKVGSSTVVASGPCLVAHPLVATVLDSGRFPGATELVLRVSEATKEVVVRADSISGAVDGSSARSADETDFVVERVAGVDLRVSLGSFFQPSRQAAELLVATVGSLLDLDQGTDAMKGVGGTFIDLYGGVGLFACALGGSFATVVVVEGEACAVRDARHNIAQLPAGTVANVVEHDVTTWRPDGALGGPVVVVADPARNGLARTGVATIAALDPTRLVLVSCDAAALGRDARLLFEAGWQLDRSVVLDLFPQTHHVEVVSRFVRS